MRARNLLLLSFLPGAAVAVLSACTPSRGAPATFQVTAAKPQDLVTAVVDGGTALVEVTSPSGIGGADVRLTGGSRPRQVVIRLHLKGLEEFQFAYGQTIVTASVPSGGGPARESVRRAGSSLDEPIAPGSPYWMRVSIVAQEGATPAVPLHSGYFEVEAPPDFVAGDSREFTIRWIDFYR